MNTIINSACLIPGLVNDVVLEIFNHFVAIDPGGPFTLMLICCNWRDFVLSNSRLWTWITVDESQPDWKDQVQVAMTLSRNQPIQLVLKLPFDSIGVLLDKFPRCRAVFLKTPKQNKALPITHKDFIQKRDQYKELHDLVALSLPFVLSRGVEAYIESMDGMCFSYATWMIFERVSSAQTLEGQLDGIHPHLISTLVLKDRPRRQPRRVQILNIWPYLPSLRYLTSLEISDNFIGVNDPSTVPIIVVSSLRRLSIDCATGWCFRTKGFAFDLFSLLGRLDAVAICDVVLSGSVNRLIAAVCMANDRVRPSSLRLHLLSTKDRGQLPQPLEKAPILRWVQQLTIDLFGLEQSSTNRLAPTAQGLIESLKFLTVSVSKGCHITFCGREELRRIPELIAPSFEDLNFVYKGGSCLNRQFYSTTPSLWSLTSQMDPPSDPTHTLWLQYARHVVFEDADLDIFFNHAVFAIRTTVKVLDAGISTIEAHKGHHSCHSSYGDIHTFHHLSVIRSTTEVATVFIEHFYIRSLREITLCMDQYGSIGPFNAFVSAICRRNHFLTQLETLGVEAFPPWTALIRLISATRSKRGGLNTVKLPGLPHPSMLQLLTNALAIDPQDCMRELTDNDEHGGEGLAYDRPGVQWDWEDPGCSACSGSGWTCYEGAECVRFSPGKVVSITKETYVGDYVL